MEYIPLKDRFFKINEQIENLNYLITKFKNKIKSQEIEKDVKDLCATFDNYYNPKIGLKRFLIPVFGKVSSGKSTLLNYLMNFHGIFETKSKPCTKFICIIRHNPNLTNELKLFNVAISERGEYKSRKLWNFEKGDEISGDIKEIIAKRNNEIDKLNNRHSNWEKYFMIIEANIPLFQGYNQVYSELFEFMDLPGLNEFNADEFYYKELIPFFIYNVGFSLYVFDLGDQEGEASISIINNIMNLYFDNDPNKQKNSIFILNKIDLISEPEKGLEKLKDFLAEKLKCHIDQNGFFIGLSGLKLYRRRFKYNSFFDYLLYILEEIKGNEDLNFEEYIIKNLSNDFKDDTIEENLDILEEEEIPKEEKKLLDEINDKATGKNVQNLTYGNYKYYSEIFQKYPKNKKEDLGEQHQKFESLLIKNFNNILEEYYNNFTYKDLRNKLIKELGLTDEDLKIKKIDIKKNSNISIDEPFEFIKSIKNIIISLAKLAGLEQNDYNEPTSSNIPKDSNVPKSSNIPKDSNVPKSSNDPKSSNVPKSSNESKSFNNPKSSNESNELEESDEFAESKELVESNEFEDSKDHDEFEDSKEPKDHDELAECKDSKEHEQLEESKEPKDHDEVAEFKEPKESNDQDVIFIKEMFSEYQEAVTDMKQKKIRIPLLGEYSSGKSSLLNTIIGHDYDVLPVSIEVCTNIALVIKYTKDEKDIALYHTFLEKTSRDFYIFNTEKNPLAKGIKTIRSLLNLLNVLYSSLQYKESFQNQVLQYVVNLDKLEESHRIYNIDNFTKILKEKINVATITDYSLRKNFEKLLSYLNDSSEDKKDLYERSFFLLTIPIEEFDNLNIPDSTKELIELIDFPGLNSANNIFKSKVLEHLIKISDGFIFVNKGDSIKEKEKAQMIFDIIHSIQQRKYEFTFKSCLFILNQCDRYNIDLDECRKEFEDLFQIEEREKTWNEILSKNNKLKEINNFNITKFSNKLYSDFKSYKNKIKDYDKYLEFYENKIDVTKYQGINYLKYLRKQVYGDVNDISLDKYKTYQINSENIEKFKKHFKLYLYDSKNKSIILDIIKMYLFLKDSYKETKIYIKSNAQDFLRCLEKQITTSQLFYKDSLKAILFEFIKKINTSFEFLLLKLLNDKIDSRFKKEDFTRTREEINEKLFKTQEENKKIIKSKYESMISQFDNLIKDIKDNKCKNYEASFEENWKEINKIKEALNKEINEKILNFQKELAETFKKYIGNKLEEIKNETLSIYQEDKINTYVGKDIDEMEKNFYLSIGGFFNGLFGGIGQFMEDAGNAIVDNVPRNLISGEDVNFLLMKGAGALGAAYKGFQGFQNLQGLSVIGAKGLAFLGSSLIPAIGIGVAASLTFAGLLHGGFFIYKKFTKKPKFIDLIEKTKNDLRYDLYSFSASHNRVLKYFSSQIENDVQKFEMIMFSKNEVLQKNKKELLNIYNHFKKMIS